MNMPPPGPQGQPPGQPQGDPSQGQNPVIQAIQTLGQFIQRMAQRDPQGAQAAGKALNQFIEIIKGEGQKQSPGQPQEAEGEQEQQGEAAPAAPSGKKKMGPMPMNAKKGAVQVL